MIRLVGAGLCAGPFPDKQMRYDFRKRPRKQIRLQGYDYTNPGYYYVTVCTLDRLCLFGDIKKGEMIFSKIGWMIYSTFENLSKTIQTIDIDTFVVMPNHIHAIIVILGTRPARRPAPTDSLPNVIAKFKSFTTQQYRLGIGETGCPDLSRRLWQRGYYEHIIRNETNLNQIRQYILENPLKWDEDKNNPNFIK